MDPPNDEVSTRKNIVMSALIADNIFPFKVGSEYMGRESRIYEYFLSPYE